MSKRRVVVTGVGPVTPIGIGKDTFWNNLVAGKSGIGPISQFDTTDFTVKIAGEVKDFDYTAFIDKKEGKRMDRVTHFAVAAAKLAIEDAKLDMSKENPLRCGVCVGSGIGGIHTFLEQSLKLGSKGPSKISPFFIPMEIPNMSAGQIAIATGLKGPNTAIVTACATGTNCIGDALRTIQYGDADVMLAGGTEAAVSPIAIAGFANMKALSTNNENPEAASCPFDKKRDGFVMGEGAGVVVLEELEHAKARGARIYAEMAGYGSTGDAYHITSPAEDGSGAGMAMKFAMKEAGIQPEQVDYINAHGTSTHHNDLLESRAIRYALGKAAETVVINSTKSMVGHMLGAAGAVEVIVCVKSIEDQFIHQTIGTEHIDPECGLNYAVGSPVEKKIDYAMSNSLGFGGHNVSLIVKRYEE